MTVLGRTVWVRMSFCSVLLMGAEKNVKGLKPSQLRDFVPILQRYAYVLKFLVFANAGEHIVSFFKETVSCSPTEA